MHTLLTLPETGFLRVAQIIGKPATKHRPAIPALIPVSASTWFQGVADGRFPKPTKFGTHTAMYRVEDVRDLIAHGPLNQRAKAAA